MVRNTWQRCMYNMMVHGHTIPSEYCFTLLVVLWLGMVEGRPTNDNLFSWVPFMDLCHYEYSTGCCCCQMLLASSSQKDLLPRHDCCRSLFQKRWGNKCVK